MARGDTGWRLTVRERILLHLAERVPEGTEYRASEELTQAGLARAAGVAQKHVPQYVRSMADEGLVAERSARVEGSRQRKKAYFVTDGGRMEASRLRGELLDRQVEVELDGSRHTMSLRDALREHFRGASLVALVRALETEGTLRPPKAPEPGARPTSAPTGDHPAFALPSVRAWLEQATELEHAYDWTGAITSYRKALREMPPGEAAPRGVVEERLAHAVFRAAMQSERVEEFALRIGQAVEAHRQAQASYETVGTPLAAAQAVRARAWVAYASAWRAQEPSERHRLLRESWDLTKDALKAFEASGAGREVGLTYAQLSRAPMLSVHFDGDGVRREAVAREALEWADTAVDRLSRDGSAVPLAIAYVRAICFKELLAGCYVSDPNEKQRLLRTETSDWKRALTLSEPSALLEAPIAESLSGTTDTLFSTGTKETLELGERALAEARRSGDRLLIGFALDMLAFHTFWMGLALDDLEERTRLLDRSLQHAEEARRHFEAISFMPPGMGAIWSPEPYPYYWSYLAFNEMDASTKRDLLRKALDRMPAMYSQAERSGYPYALSTAHYVEGLILDEMARIETNVGEKRRILEKDLAHQDEAYAIDLRIYPCADWDLGLEENHIAAIQFELADLSEDPEAKRSLLEAAVAGTERSIERLRGALIDAPSMRLYAVGRSWFDYGDLLERLHGVSKERTALAKAVDAFLAAAGCFSKADLASRAAESSWKAAKVLDRLGEHGSASESFLAASKDYGIAGQRIPHLKAFYEDHARYMRGWSEIENARSHHERQAYAAAKESYERAAVLLFAGRWKSFAPNYLAWARLEGAEDLSRREKGAEAIRSFEDAIQFFEQTEESLKRDRGSMEAPERTLADELIRACELRREYCRARVLLEDAKLVARRGDHAAAADRHGLASAAFKRLERAVEREEDRRDLRLIAILAAAWQRMAAAEADASADSFVEASRHFEDARAVARNETSRMLVLGHSRLCLALAAGARFADTRDPGSHRDAIRQLESAATYYAKAGYPGASDYAKASKLLFDAYAYLDRANEETDPERKAKLYGMVERVLEASADAFAGADQPAKREEALRLLGRVKEERQLAVSLMEVLQAPAIASSTSAFATPAPSFEAPVGLERFEHADVHGNLIAPDGPVPRVDTLLLELGLVNAGRAPARLVKVENIAPEGFDLVAAEGACTLEESHLDLKGRRLEPLKTEELKVVLRPRQPGVYTFRPRIVYLDEDGRFKRHELDPVDLTVSG
ncbi:MAG: hypothetical protein ACT4OI_02550 [Methanobacteriota archaeon]